METNYLAESRLKKLSEELHDRYVKCVAKADKLLVRYRSNFPDYTDHTLLHSVQVTNTCNILIQNNIDNLNGHELYILLMSALLHDVGMGLTRKEAERYKKHITIENPEKKENPIQKKYSMNDNYSENAFIRDYHHELSALFILYNYEECLIPNEQLALAIAKVSKGHRKTDLFNISLYPSDYPAAKGVRANLAYLAAVLRLADEMDISSERNLMLQYAGFVPRDEKSVSEFRKHCLTNCEINQGIFRVTATPADAAEYDELSLLYEKLSSTYEYCAEAAMKRAGITLGITSIENGISPEGIKELEIEVKKIDNVILMRLRGRLSANSAPYLENKLVSRLHEGLKELVLDFKYLEYISSAGLRVVLSAQKKLTSLGGELEIINVCDDIKDIFKITGFNNILKIKN